PTRRPLEPPLPPSSSSRSRSSTTSSLPTMQRLANAYGPLTSLPLSPSSCRSPFFPVICRPPSWDAPRSTRWMKSLLPPRSLRF
ncbi:hypothetical protein BGZ58_004846, partial [Dissophora ornata]